MTLTASIFINT